MNGSVVVDLYSPLWALLIFAALHGMASLPIFRFADARAATMGRAVLIDGLRGYLACGVMLHHAAIYYSYAATGVWAPTNSIFYNALATVGVGMFFMITAYLFWGRIIRGGVDWIGLYVGRVFRIGPLYFIAAAAVLLVSAISTGALDLLSAIRWLGLGALGEPDINGFRAKRVVAGVTWTLFWEWCFYLSLLPLSVIRRFHWAVGVVGLGGSLVLLGLNPSEEHTLPSIGAFFSLGMLCASARAVDWRIKLHPGVAAFCTLSALASALFLFDKPYSVPVVLLAGLAFVLIENGYDALNLFSNKASIRLGNLSYGIYLLHGIVFFIVFAIPSVRAAAVSEVSHWFVMLPASLLVSLVALALHRPIELGGNEFGRSALRRWRSLRR